MQEVPRVVRTIVTESRRVVSRAREGRTGGPAEQVQSFGLQGDRVLEMDGGVAAPQAMYFIPPSCALRNSEEDKFSAMRILQR